MDNIFQLTPDQLHEIHMKWFESGKAHSTPSEKTQELFLEVDKRIDDGFARVDLSINSLRETLEKNIERRAPKYYVFWLAVAGTLMAVGLIFIILFVGLNFEKHFRDIKNNQHNIVSILQQPMVVEEIINDE